MAKRIGPEAKIIALFTALPDDSKRIVLDVIKSSQATTPRKTTKKRTAPKGAMCNVCANEEDHPDHDTTYLSSHPFVFPGVATAGKKSSRKGAANSASSTGTNTDSALDVVHGAIGEL